VNQKKSFSKADFTPIINMAQGEQFNSFDYAYPPIACTPI